MTQANGGVPVRFGFKTSPQYTTWRELLAFWRTADEIPFYESGWVFDHFYPIPQPAREFAPSGPCLEGWSVLAALASATARLRLGMLVTGIHYRNVAVLAKMAVAVDHISAGRLELGLGAGWNEQESDAYGIFLGSPSQRSDRLEEACAVLTSLLTEDVTNFSGTYFTLTGAMCEPKSVQQPRPPIIIGGSGERRTLRTAARFADHWNYVGVRPELFPRKRQVLREHCAALGRDPSEIVLSSHVWLAGSTAADLAAMTRTVEYYAGQQLDLAIIYVLPPLDPAVLELASAALADFSQA